MKKFSIKKLTIISFLLCCFICTISFFLHAQGLNTITLKDGSVLKGQISSDSDGYYTIFTEHLGPITVSEDDIANIAAKPAVKANTAQNNNTNQQQAVPNNLNLPPMLQGMGGGQDANPGLMQQAQQLQGQIMNNPAMMQDIQGLLANPEIMNIISDPNLMKDLMTYDPNKIQNNPKIQSLMNNPEMKKLMQKMQGQLGQ